MQGEGTQRPLEVAENVRRPKASNLILPPQTRISYTLPTPIKPLIPTPNQHMVDTNEVTNSNNSLKL